MSDKEYVMIDAKDLAAMQSIHDDQVAEIEQKRNEIMRLLTELSEVREAYYRAATALRATNALLDPMLMEHRNRIDDNAPIIEELRENGG